jgi:hypothetical protein
MNRIRTTGIALGLVAAALALGACGSDNGDGDSSDAGADTVGGDSTLPVGSDPVTLDPADFTTEIDNPYWPMKVGSRWVYDEGDARVVVTVTDRTKEIANGITARVVHDVVSEGGQPKEVTDDWYAQDSDGNIWYLGEDTAEYENGKVTTREGSFEAGVDGAQPGIAVPGDPQVGQTYRQEYYKGQAEDFASVLSLDGKADVPFGSFTGLLQTEDVNPLSDPKQVEHKFYAEGVGPVYVIDTVSDDTEELVSYTEG